MSSRSSLSAESLPQVIILKQEVDFTIVVHLLSLTPHFLSLTQLTRRQNRLCRWRRRRSESERCWKLGTYWLRTNPDLNQLLKSSLLFCLWSPPILLSTPVKLYALRPVRWVRQIFSKKKKACQISPKKKKKS